MSLDTLTDTPKRRGRPPRNPIPDYLTPSASPQQLPPVAQEAPLFPPPAVTPDPSYELYANVPKPKMVSVRLLRNYRPEEKRDPDPANKTGFLPPMFEVVGHWTDEVKRKMPDGQVRVITPSEFIEGEVKPPIQPGTGSANKLLAGTIIRVSTDEAKIMRKNGIGEIEIDD